MADQRTIHVPTLNPAGIPSPSREIYPAMGRDNIYRMIEDFYRALGASPIQSMFSPDLAASSRKSAAFFVQLLGGPQEYSERHGPPRMRARHLPFRITQRARQEWLLCFERVLSNATVDYDFPAEHLEGFRKFLDGFSQWMVNADETS